MENLIKIFLSILLFGCLAEMPFGYYQFVRFSGMLGFILLAYKAYEQGKLTKMIILFCLALLFQPIVKISFGRQIWNIVDVVVGSSLIISIFIKGKSDLKN